MKFLAILLILIGLGFSAYQKYVEIPKLNEEISSLNDEVNSLKRRLKEVPKERGEVERGEVEPEIVVKKESVPVVKQDPQTIVQDNSLKIAELEATLQNGEASFQQQKATLEAEIQRGLEARKIAQSAQGNFKERTNGSSIRTSDADRRIWEEDKQARISAINAKLEELNIQKNQLESNFRTWSRNISDQISALK
jgi:hypothetical protein